MLSNSASSSIHTGLIVTIGSIVTIVASSCSAPSTPHRVLEPLTDSTAETVVREVSSSVSRGDSVADLFHTLEAVTPKVPDVRLYSVLLVCGDMELSVFADSPSRYVLEQVMLPEGRKPSQVVREVTHDQREDLFRTVGRDCEWLILSVGEHWRIIARVDGAGNFADELRPVRVFAADRGDSERSPLADLKGGTDSDKDP